MQSLPKIGFMLLAAVLLSGNIKNYGQIEEVGNLIAGGAEDAQTLLQPYITPAVNGFGAALSGGWFNTAKTHELGGFDITWTTSIAIVPQKYETFLIDNNALINLKLADPLNNETPTIAGEKISGPQMVYSVDTYTEPAFTMPEGLNTNYVPSPMLQAGIGLIKNTDLIVRYLPNIKYKGNEIGLWGLGGKHDLKQWIPGLKDVPALQISLMYGYTRLHTQVDLDVDKSTIGASSLPGEESNAWNDQFMNVLVQSHTGNLLASFDLSVISVYGGLGFVVTKTNLKFEGEYPVVYLDGSTPSVQALADPIDMEIKNQDGSITKPRFNAGVRLKLAFFTMHFDYSWANYSVVTGGLGISFR
jgi:hypothetical protein